MNFEIGHNFKEDLKNNIYSVLNIIYIFCCRSRKEIKHTLSCLLQNNIQGGEVLFEIEKPRLLDFKQHFHTEEVILQQPQEQVLYSILPRQQNRADCFPL